MENSRRFTLFWEGKQALQKMPPTRGKVLTLLVPRVTKVSSLPTVSIDNKREKL